MNPIVEAWLKEGETVLRQATEACPELRDVLRLIARSIESKPPQPRLFTLYQPGSPHDGFKQCVCSMRELEHWLNRQDVRVGGHTGSKGYEVYEPDLRHPGGKWLVGFIDRPFSE